MMPVLHFPCSDVNARPMREHFPASTASLLPVRPRIEFGGRVRNVYKALVQTVLLLLVVIGTIFVLVRRKILQI